MIFQNESEAGVVLRLDFTFKFSVDRGPKALQPIAHFLSFPKHYNSFGSIIFMRLVLIYVFLIVILFRFIYLMKALEKVKIKKTV